MTPSEARHRKEDDNQARIIKCIERMKSRVQYDLVHSNKPIKFILGAWRSDTDPRIYQPVMAWLRENDWAVSYYEGWFFMDDYLWIEDNRND